MLRRISFPGWRLLAPVFAVVVLLSLLAACGVEDAAPTAQPPTMAPATPTQAATSTSEDPTPAPTQLSASVAAQESTTVPPTPALSLSNGETPEPPAPKPTATAMPPGSETEARNQQRSRRLHRRLRKPRPPPSLQRLRRRLPQISHRRIPVRRTRRRGRQLRSRIRWHAAVGQQRSAHHGKPTGQGGAH